MIDRYVVVKKVDHFWDDCNDVKRTITHYELRDRLVLFWWTVARLLPGVGLLSIVLGVMIDTRWFHLAPLIFFAFIFILDDLLSIGVKISNSKAGLRRYLQHKGLPLSLMNRIKQ